MTPSFLCSEAIIDAQTKSNLKKTKKDPSGPFARRDLFCPPPACRDRHPCHPSSPGCVLSYQIPSRSGTSAKDPGEIWKEILPWRNSFLIYVFDTWRDSSLEEICRHSHPWGNSIPTLVQEWRNFATSGDLQGGEICLSFPAPWDLPGGGTHRHSRPGKTDTEIIFQIICNIENNYYL